MKIELNNQQITLDGKPAGTYDGIDYTPSPSLTKAKIKAVTKFLQALADEGIGIAEASPGDEGLGGFAPSPGECPAQDPSLGDKTPAVVEWYRDNQPEEFARRYHGRKTHLGRIT